MTRQTPLKARLVLDVHGAFLRRTNLSGTKLCNANLSHADFSRASFKGADFRNARLTGTILRGADLTNALNLTIEQIESAVIDQDTRLPAYLDPQHLSNGTSAAGAGATSADVSVDLTASG